MMNETCQGCKWAVERCQHPDGNGMPTYIPTADGKSWADACELYESDGRVEPESTGPEHRTVIYGVSCSDEFDAEIGALLADGWQPVAFNPVCTASDDVLLIQTLVRMG